MLGLTLLLTTIPFHPSVLPITVDGELCHPNHLIVKMKDLDKVTDLQVNGIRLIRTLPEIGYAVVETPTGQLQASRKSLSRLPSVDHVDLDRAAQPAYDPNDPLWPNQWDMKTIKADLAWNTTFGSPITVAVIDTGVMVDHEDLAANIWTNPGEIAGNGIDDDGDGYIDDVHGYDFAYGNSDITDNFGHGTCCAGLVGAVQDNLLGVSGVAPHARIMVLKAATDDGYFYDSATVPAYLYAANKGANVLSMSYFSDHVSQAEKDAIDFCWAHNILPVAAAGNNASVIPYYPGGYEDVLSVAATVESNDRAGFSNYGSWVDVAAPGVDLYTTTHDGQYTSGFAGTSGATPHVAGLATLVFGAKPGLTNAQVMAAIEDTATPLSSDFSNYGLVNAQAAVQAVLTNPAPPKPPIVRYITPFGVQPVANTITPNIPFARVYGRGFQTPNTVQVKVGGSTRSIINQTRDYFDYAISNGQGAVTVLVNGNVIATLNRPISSIFTYPLIEASTKDGASLTGGFLETLNMDSSFIDVTKGSNGFIYLEGDFRKVKPSPSGTMTLTWKRNYTGSPASLERVLLYNWSTNSYPYGNWDTFYTAPLPQTPTLTSVSVPNIANYIDPEGTVYVMIKSTDDALDGSEMHLDYLNLHN